MTRRAIASAGQDGSTDATDANGAAAMIDPGPPSRDVDLRLARLHLRTGSLTMARAEYESLVAAGPLDPDDLVDLAEVRWRTGDVAGAGDAAAAHLELGGGSGRALGIAAEAAAAIGRTVEAERLAVRAEQRLGESVADFFAGMPMRAAWPAGPGPARAQVPLPVAQAPLPVAQAPLPASAPAPLPVPEAPLLVPEAPRPASVAPAASPPEPHAELGAARRALAEGRTAAAALHFAIVLRRDPGLAPTVLDAIDAQAGPAFEIVRGDAYRLVGHDADAQAAYALASATLAQPDGTAGSSSAAETDDRSGGRDVPDPGAVR